MSKQAKDKPTYIFAYGSLIWRPGFRYLDVQLVKVKGFERRFWQASHDHRGTLTHPGRVVTLVPVTDSFCEGLAYRLDDNGLQQTLAALDEREQDGYQRQWLDAYSIAGCEFGPVLTWVASAGNPSWVGEEAVEQTADLIAKRWGPSGSNLEYLLELGSALSRIGIQDAHVATLVDLQSEA